MAIIAYTQQAMDMKDVFGTLANCTVSIYTFIEKCDTNRSRIRAYQCDLIC